MAVIRLVQFGGAHDFSLSQVEQHNVGVGADRPELIDPKVDHAVDEIFLFGSPPMFWNGSTAIEGLSGNGAAYGWTAAVPAACGPEARGPTRYTRTGREMFLTCWSPISPKAKSSLSRT